MISREDLLEGLAAAALDAGVVVWRHFQAGFEVVTKSDSSPVTAADHEAEAVILKALAALDPEGAVVAEEEAAAGRVPDPGERFWLVDPLDGTREFVRRGTDFTVNIGLVEGDQPTMGVIYAPARGDLYAGDVARGEAWRARCEPGGAPGARSALRVRAPREPLAALASRSHSDPATDAYLGALPVGERINIGSSLKFVLVASGEADLYPRTGPTMEWDTCAGHAILLAAGGSVQAPDGSPFRYRKAGFRNTGFVATGGYLAPPLGPFLEA